MLLFLSLILRGATAGAASVVVVVVFIANKMLFIYRFICYGISFMEIDFTTILLIKKNKANTRATEH